MFAVANALLLRPLTFPAPDELVTIELFDRKASTTTLTGRAPGRKLFDAWRTAATDKIDLAGFGVGSAAVSRVPSARTVQLVGVTWNMFRVLGLAPTYGRAFDSGDEIQVPLTPIVLSDASWSLLFGRDITAIGRTIDINGRSCIIVGIMPTGYHVPLSISEARQNDPELWMPMAAFVAMDGDGDANYPIEVVGRLRPQRPVIEVTGELQAIATGADTSIASEAPLPKLVPLTDAVSRSVRTPLLLLVAAVGLLLLLGSFNIANLLLTSTLARGRELATRVALGALPAHIALQLAIEVFVLVLAGAGIGVGLAFSALPGLLRLGQWYLPSTRAIAIDWRVLAFSALLSLVAGVGVAIWPAYRAVRQSPMGAMTSRSKSVGRHTRRLMKLLVIGQVAVSVVILANMGVLGRSFSRLLNLDRGYDPHGVVTAAFILPSHRYATVSSRRLFWRALQESLDSRPGACP